MVRDPASGACRGIVAVNVIDMTVQAFPADAVMIATGGPGLIFGRTTNSMVNTGSAAAAVYLEGGKYANGEFIQVHPTAIPGEDKLRLMSESARGEGGRVWVPKRKGDPRPPREIPESDRWFFLEEKYPRYGNLVPRDVAVREIYDICVNRGMGVGGGMMVYLDVSHLSREELDRKLGGILEIYEKFVGVDPREEPMKIFPAVHYSMGGIWTGFEPTADGLVKAGSPQNQATSIPGLYAGGEVDHQYHGANRLGANSLLSCVYAGMIGGPAMIAHAQGLPQVVGDGGGNGAAAAAVKHWEGRLARIAKLDGPENPFALHREFSETMNENVTVVRYNDKLRRTDERIQEWMERWQRTSVLDASGWTNQPLLFVNQLWNMLELARVITLGALHRDESRGAHYKPDFPQRDDASWLKTTIATWSPEGPRFTYEPVDTSLVQPVARKYD
jgi:succinate dehydrogenase / fumarate reductase flavoprotein subunit